MNELDTYPPIRTQDLSDDFVAAHARDELEKSLSVVVEDDSLLGEYAFVFHRGEAVNTSYAFHFRKAGNVRS